MHSRVCFHLPENVPKRSPRFSPGYEDTEKMLYLLRNKDTDVVDKIHQVTVREVAYRCPFVYLHLIIMPFFVRHSEQFA